MGTTYSWSKFASAWNRAGSANEVAKALRCSAALVRSRACYLRKAGFKLKRFRPGRKVAK